MRFDERNADFGAMAEVDCGGVERQLMDLRPEVELIAVGAAVKAVENTFGEMDRERAPIGRH
jgi:hypothetical protein